MASITHEDLQSDHGDHAEGHSHPTERTYWKVGGALFVLTALEVSTYWWPEDMRKVTAVLLVIMMIIKFVTVAGYFMHLKYDQKILRQVFFGGFVLAVGVYLATLGSMVFFDNSGNVEEIYNDPPRVRTVPPPPTEAPPPFKPYTKHG